MKRYTLTLATALLTCALCACDQQNTEPQPSPTQQGNAPAPGQPAPTPSSTPSSRPTSNPTGTPTPSGADWNITVYYTAVESFHTGASTSVSGCLDLQCSSRGTIGSYPSDFVKATKDEGTGRITSGAHAGNYLNWSSDVGYWLDTAPRNSYGGALIPWVSAAADQSVLPRGTNFKVTDCGTDDSGGGSIDPNVCNQLKQANWNVTDEFTPGLGGSYHLDLYIGEEDQANFVNSSPKEISVKNAQIATQ